MNNIMTISTLMTTYSSIYDDKLTSFLNTNPTPEQINKEVNGETLLQRIAANHTENISEACFKRLLEMGARLDTYNYSGDTVLYRLCFNLNVSKVKVVLEYSSDLEKIRDVISLFIFPSLANIVMNFCTYNTLPMKEFVHLPNKNLLSSNTYRPLSCVAQMESCNRYVDQNKRNRIIKLLLEHNATTNETIDSITLGRITIEELIKTNTGMTSSELLAAKLE